jgi:drug/metabolite transporter (DMT)-like permease
VNGYLAAAVAVVIVASYPVATRAAVTGSFSPEALVLLRFSVGSFLFLPYLLMHFRTITREVWLRGVLLTLFQGVGMGALVICGLRFAPASHQAALGPGVSPAWVVLLGFLIFAKRPTSRTVAGGSLCAIGVFGLAFWSAANEDLNTLTGDAMFLAASALGALYVLQLRNWGMNAIQAAAIVTVYSAAVIVPWHLCFAKVSLSQVSPAELLWQILWQGILIGCVALLAFNHAITRLGAERSSAMVALVPALTAVFALLFLGEVPTIRESVAILAISAGAWIGASRGYRGNPASTNAPTSRAACGLSRPG